MLTCMQAENSDLGMKMERTVKTLGSKNNTQKNSHKQQQKPSRFISVFIPLILQSWPLQTMLFFFHVFPTTLPEEQIPCFFEVKIIERPSGFT